ncbi:MAG: ROK family protein [Tannerellaceae bacterium]|jgi:glucokinase|nr:ROK family protein [Tannerellaceae bacterium]
MNYAIALDVGGTRIKYALISQEGGILYEQKVFVEKEEEKLVTTFKRIVGELLDLASSRKAHVVGIGIGVPAVVDNGLILFANNLPALNKIRLDNMLTESFALPVCIENDANLMGLAEARYGAAMGASDVVFLTVGTGIGGALILNGQLYGGYRNRGTEMGHIIVHGDGHGRNCTCGATGCLEAQASVTALVRDYKEQLRMHKQSIPAEVDGEYIVAMYLENQLAAVEAMNSHFHWLATGIASFINIFAPQKVIIGGGISEAGPFYIEAIRERAGKLVMQETACFTSIEAARFGNKSGFLGAATLVFESYL